jgi:hypothetical protein
MSRMHGSTQSEIYMESRFQQPSPITSDIATGGTCVVIARVPMRTNDDGIVLDAHFDFGSGSMSTWWRIA